MDTESLYVMSGLYGMLVLGILGGIYLLVNYIKTRKRKLEKEKEEKRRDELDNQSGVRRLTARISLYEFKKKVHLINPITFTNGITVSFVERENPTKNTSFGVEYKINSNLYYDILYSSSGIDDVTTYNKYSLEDLEGYDWIIETAYNFTEDRIKKIEEDKVKEELFVKNINDNELILKK